MGTLVQEIVMSKIIILFCVCFFSMSVGADTVKTDRYTTVSLEPRADQQEPLYSVVNIRFSQNIKTVGEAINEMLKGSGYRWSPTDADMKLNELELPSINRELGPIRLQDGLQVLAGSSWGLSADKLNRTISFVINQ
jgi:conjugative transfer region protein (TIGR03748 family)